MSCNSCSTDSSGIPRGCKSNGNCGTGTCGSGSKLAVFDWLSNMTLPNGELPFNIYEVRFKNGRKHFFKDIENLKFSMGDIVAVESFSGHDVGVVSLGGELVKVQLRKKKISVDSQDIKKIYRKASQRDIEVWQFVRAKEEETQRRGREIISELGLKMKLSDVEYRGDGNKAIFYYTSESYVDFRELIKKLSINLSVRAEMKQVGLRQEAARLGGIGSCGRELCCSTWLTDLRKVKTEAARYQQLSLNTAKLTGQCGKLKCCLNYELDTYLDALKDFPKQDIILKTEKGTGVFIKMDIFKKILWYTYKDDSSKWFKLTLDQVREIIDLNKKNKKSSPLEDYESEAVGEVKIDFQDAVGQDSLTRFDRPKKKKNNRNISKSKANLNTNRPFENRENRNKPNSKKNKRSKQRNRNKNDDRNEQE